MADEPLEHEHDEDDPFSRDEDLLESLGIPASLFQGVLNDAIDHASVAARADAPLVPLPWIPMGPRNVGGRIRALAQDPRAPSTIYAGSAFGGMWKTTNAGDTWIPLDDFRPPNPPNAVRQALPIGAIAIAPKDRRIIYVGTGEPTTYFQASTGTYEETVVSGNGLYRSTDEGLTFQQLDRADAGPLGSPPPVIGARRFERIIVDPWEPSRLWIACLKGLWRGEPSVGGRPNDPPTFVQDVVNGAGLAANQVATDVVIDFGARAAALDFNPAEDPPPEEPAVYVALRGIGIFRNFFRRDRAIYTGAWEKLDHGLDEPAIHRIKLAMCASHPNVLYAVFDLTDHSASRVYKSLNDGTLWQKTAERPDEDGNVANYALVLEVHPDNPDIVFTGAQDLYRSLNQGRSWQKVMNWELNTKGDRAQHADQHALLFDRLDRRTIWVANDGGISMSRDLGTTWRKRSHGILATQFYDITVHPRFPFIMIGGLQDNGSWLSFGGPSWFQLSGGDGGAAAFDPTSQQSFLTTVQGWNGSGTPHQLGVTRCLVNSSTAELDSANFLNPLPDVPVVPPATASTKMQSVTRNLVVGFLPNHAGPFTGVIEHHPRITNHAIIGRKRGAYLTTNWTSAAPTVTQLATGAFTPVTAEVSAVAYAPNAPDTDWWIGTSQGQVFMTGAGMAAVAWNPILLPDIGTQWISDIAVHPRNRAIIAIAVAGTPGRVYLSGDTGLTWQEISGRFPLIGPASPPADQLTTSPITCIAFDPQSPAAVASAQTLYVGTLAGVYVIRNAIAPVAPGPPPLPPPPPAPVWRTFNRGLPLVLVYDIAPVVQLDAHNNVVRTALRCATLGRGIYECDLAGTPAARLYIRKTPIDDGRVYDGPSLNNDPRQTPMPPLTNNNAFDIRVDAPPFFSVDGVDFEEVLDGVEFDEELPSDQLIPGERNLVYVQVHNSGTDTLPGVAVHLFFASAAAAPAGANWQPVAPAQTVNVGPAQPAVARFEWTPPANVPNPVALMAICTHALDPMPAVPPAAVDPANPGAERRAALRFVAVTPFVGDVYVRDGVDDDGSPGSVAWGGRSPDIIVLQAAETNPDATFTDLTDLRRNDKVKGGVMNHVYVRVHNRRNVPLSAVVDLYQAPFATMDQGATWVRLGSNVPVNDIPPRGWKFTAAIPFPNPADPDTSPNPHKVYLLVAVVSRPDDASPVVNAINNLDLFWRFFLRDPVGNNAALRTLRFEP